MPKPLLILLALSLSSIFFFSKTSNGTDTISSNCFSHRCGGVQIDYPFWLMKNTTSNQFCGYQGFNLSCSKEEIPIIDLSGVSYFVKNISYTDFTLTLVEVAVTTNQTCPQARHNVTIQTLPLSFNKSDLFLSFYFNCSSLLEAAANSVECLSSNGNESYVFAMWNEPVAFDQWYDYCEEKVHLIVMNSTIDRTNGLVGGFGEALKEGFVLDWRPEPACRACEASEGRCGYNINEGSLCFCSDQFVRMNDTCKALDKNPEIAPTPMITFPGASPPPLITFPDETTCARCRSSGGFCGSDSKVFVCHCPGGTESMTCQKPGRSKLALILETASGVSTVGILIIALFYIIVKKLRQSESIFFWKTKTENYRNIEAFLKNCGSFCPKRYTYSDIKKITNSFRTKLGQGGFGCVYKGQLENGRLVAVKVLKGSKGNGDEFINEVATISRTSHVHIVSFLGFCFEGRHRALVYEFMPNGSLDKFIHDGGSLTNNQLGWEALFQIAVGIAGGLEYLHRGCNTRILHFDIKPHNILLNEDFCPKISDFGLAKLCPQKDSIVSLLGTRGTPGYIAPEVFNRNFGGVSHKSDVYSYGMMVLEMVGQRKNNMSVEVDRTSENYFPHWVYKRLELDEELGSHGITSEEANATVRKMIIVGLWCIQIDPSHRPSMSRVLEMLEGSLESLQIPPKPFFSSPTRAPIDSSTTQSTLMS